MKTVKKGLFNKTTTITHHRPFGAAVTQEEPQQPTHRTQASGVGSTVEADVAVILLWSIIVGSMVMVAVVFIGVAAGYYLDLAVWPSALFIGGGLGLLMMIAIMLLGISDRRKLWWVIEKHLDADLDGDGVTGAPALTLNIEYQDEVGFKFRRLDLPAGTNLDAFYQLVCAALNGLPVSENRWTPTRRGFSTNKFRVLMQKLEQDKIFEKTDSRVSNSPRLLTGYGRSVFREFKETYPLHRAREEN